MLFNESLKVTKGPGSKAAGIAMASKLIESAQERWRAVNPSSSRSSAPGFRPSISSVMVGQNGWAQPRGEDQTSGHRGSGADLGMVHRDPVNEGQVGCRDVGCDASGCHIQQVNCNFNYPQPLRFDVQTSEDGLN